MNKDMISVTDELIFELYKLDLSFIEPIKIDHGYYLVSKTGIKYKFELGLITEIPKEMLETNSIDDIVDACNRKDENYASLTSLLTFTPKEMFVMNILLSNFLTTDSRLIPEISFREMDFYRKRISALKNVSVNRETAESYKRIINSLASKILYLKTDPKFRKRPKKDYGVSNRDFQQDLLTIFNYYEASSNNLSFKYSFGEFGEILKLSRRWSDLVPARCYHFSLNQAIYNVIACDIARQIFITRDRRGKCKYYDSQDPNYTGFDFDFEYYFELIHGKSKRNMKRQRIAFYENLKIILNSFKQLERIDSYEFIPDDATFIRGKSFKVRIELYFLKW